MIWVLLIAIAPAFFYKLGQTSLLSWDEAWYAEIGKQLLMSGNLLVMRFNNQVFTDHPVSGFWLIALGQLIFGINEFGSRVMSAVFGLLGILGTYLLGKELYGRVEGWLAALGLAVAPWYLYRARTGNLDIFLTTLMVWSVYLAWRAVRNRKYFVPLILVVVLLLLVKTAVPFAIIPALVVIFWGNKIYKKKEILAGILVIVAVYGTWIAVNRRVSPTFGKKYVTVGLPGVGTSAINITNIMHVKSYLHFGIGNWFRYAVVGMGVCVLLSRRKEYLVPVVMVGCLIAPMTLSTRSQIWHMIPAFPFMLLGLFGVVGLLTRKLPRVLAVVVMVGFGLWVAIPMMQKNWWEFIDIPAYVSDEAILSQRAREFPERLYIGDSFVPAAVFYSGKQVERMNGSVDELYEHADANFLLIAHSFQISATTVDVSKYEIIARDRDMVLARFIKF